MRGSPFIRLLVVVALFALAAIPLWKLTTNPSNSPVTSASTAELSTLLTRLEVTGSQPANEFVVRHLGKVVWQGKGLRAATEIPLPAQSFDLQIEATWNPVGESEHAFRIQVIRDEMPLMESTFWGLNQIEDTLTIPAN